MERCCGVTICYRLAVMCCHGLATHRWVAIICSGGAITYFRAVTTIERGGLIDRGGGTIDRGDVITSCHVDLIYRRGVINAGRADNLGHGEGRIESAAA